jgi:hypothetical protein
VICGIRVVSAGAGSAVSAASADAAAVAVSAGGRVADRPQPVNNVKTARAINRQAKRRLALVLIIFSSF